MKKYLLTLLMLTCITSFSQKRETVRGSKVVTVTQPEIGPFENLEVYNNIDVFLVKGTDNAIEFEADDNLHEHISAEVRSNTLRLSTSKDLSGFKKLSVRVTYTDNFKMVVCRDDATVTALSEIKLPELTLKCYDDSKLFAYADVKSFTLITNDKSKVELNLKSDDAIMELSKNSQLKGLVTAPKFKCDMYQKATAVIEGDVDDFKLRMDNQSNFTGKKLTSKNASLILEGSAKASAYVNSKLVLEISGKSELYFYGEGKIDVKRFTDDVSLYKRSK